MTGTTPMGTTPMGTTPMGTTPMGTTPMDEDYGTVICTSCGATVSIERLVIGVSDVTLSCPYCGRTAPAAEPETAGAYR